MAPEVAEVERALLALTPKDRAAVIERVLLSLDEVDDMDPADIDTRWRAEIDRRMGEYVSGEAKLVDADEHFAQLRTELAAHDR